MAIVKGILIAVIAYFLGNISTGLLVGKAVGHIDIRKTGSGNAGTTNVMRTLGWFPSVLTLLGDMLKAVIAVAIGGAMLGETGQYIAGVAVLLGHNWPVCFGFKGGKGMASSLGIILATEPLLALALFLIQVVILVATRYSSSYSITATRAMWCSPSSWARWPCSATARTSSGCSITPRTDWTFPRSPS